MTPSPDSSTSEPSGSPVARRFAVLGLGRTGLAYAMGIAKLPGCELAGLVDARAPLRRFARGAGFTAPATATLAQLTAKHAIDTVVIASPAEERLEQIEAAIGAGLAVLVDGLPVTHAEGAGRLEPLIAGSRAPVGCGIGVLFHPLFARAISVLQSNALGPLSEIRASVYVSRVFSATSPPAHGDVLDFGVGELLVLLDAMFGPAAAAGGGRAIEASGQHLFGPRLDEVHARVRLAEGREAVVDGSWSVPGYPRASLVVDVAGERGKLLVSDDALESDLPAACEGLPAGHARRVLADERDGVAFDSGESARWLPAFASTLEHGHLLAALDPRRALRVAKLLDDIRRAVAQPGAKREVAT
jgi:predicted dehydrogenase